MNSPDRCDPAGLWSLWDMLKESAKYFMDLGVEIYDMGMIFEFEKYATKDELMGTWELNADGRAAVKRSLEKLHNLAERLNLRVSSDMMGSRLKADNLPQSEGEWSVLGEVLKTELKSRLFLSVPPHLAPYYERTGIVGDAVIAAFPRASEEIRAAGTCFATGQNTACVFHAMRAAEIGVRALGEALQITLTCPIEEAEWQAILNAITPKIRDIENLPKSTPGRDDDLNFYSEAAAQFRFFKNGWRIRVAHARASYSEPQAKEALDHVRSFFETISVRLKEAP